MGFTQKDLQHSFGVLAYQDSPFLDKCIQSLLRQYSSCSFIYISTSCDNSSIKHVSEKYNIPLYINSSCSGIASDWSFAYQCAKTKYVTLAHQDDIYFPDYTKKCLQLTEQYPNNLITFTDYYEAFNGIYKPYTETLIVKSLMLQPFFLFSPALSSFTLKKMMLMLGSPICCPSVMYNKKNIGNYNFDHSLKINLDWDAWVKLAQKKGAFVYVNKRLMAHRIHPDSETCRGILDETRYKEDSIMFKKLWPRFLVKLISRIYSVSYMSNSKLL
jgi:hypothetical protein